MKKKETWLALALGLAAVLIRLPFTARRMWDHDSIQFALGVEKYNLAAHHPHPPGYPLYIGLLKLLAALGIPPLTSMVALSILSSGLGAALMVLFILHLLREGEEPGVRRPHRATGSEGRSPDRSAHEGAEWGRTATRLGAAALAGALYAFNPLLWFYGELPLIYAVEGALAVAIAYTALRMGERPQAFLLACALFALAGGLRQSTMVLLAPLFLYGAWHAWRQGRLSPRLLAAGAALGAALTLAWLLPLWALAGGLGEYRRIGAENFGALLPRTSVLFGAGWPALAHNLEVLAKWALQGVLPGAAVLLGLWIAAPRAAFAGLRLLLARSGWLLAWALPPLAFFALFHVTKAGYTLVHLPALLAGIAVAAAPAFAPWPAGGRFRAMAAGVAAAGLGAALFLFGADRDPRQARLWAVVRHEFNRGTIAEYEEELDRTLATLRRFPPGSTVLVAVELSGGGGAGAKGFLYPWHRHLQWYLPEYLVVLAVPEEDFALVARGHEPFRKELSQLWLPERTRQLVYVLSAPPDGRLALGHGTVTAGGKSFFLTAVPFRGSARIGPLVLTATRQRRNAA